MKLHYGLLVVVFVLVGSLPAQDSSKRKEPCQVRVQYANGSLVIVVVTQPHLKVRTDFGLQEVPFERIKKIEFGLHYPEGEEKRIIDSINALGSIAYRDRENATKYLLNSKPFAYPLLKEAAEKSGDTEFTNRTTGLIKRFKEKFSADLLSPHKEDTVHTDKFSMVGRIEGNVLKAYSENFGDLAIKFSDLRSVNGSSNTERELRLDALKYGSEPNQWLDTGIVITENTRLTVKADGVVDIWPQGPGQYVTAPKGYTTAGKGSIHMAGALIGKVGKEDKEFPIGEQYDGVPTAEGHLFLHIVPSPWNNASTGSYRVRIVTSHASR